MDSNIPSTDDNLIVIGAINSQVENLTVIGKQVIEKQIITENIDVDKIHEQTVSDIHLWTQNTVEIAALSKVLDKIQSGSPCVTITGSPGEGKSTLGFWVLRKLQDTRLVYKVRYPEQFDKVIKTSAPVVLLDDVFGQTIFDKAAWEKWKGSLERFMNMKEKKPIHEIGTLILVGRDFVFRSGSRHAEDPWKMLLDDEHVVNISRDVVDNIQEKFNIWNSLSTNFNVHLNSSEIKDICSMEISHGFPHTCKLFITLSKKGSGVSAVEFFRNPLQFLTMSLKILIQDEVIEHIFMEMIKGDGHVVKCELGKRGSKFITTANDLCTYIKPEGNGYVFDHPSILDTVALLMCETKLHFILEHCSIEFIKERVWLQTPDGKKRNKTGAAAKLMAEIQWNEAEEIARWFVKKIQAGQLWNVKFHTAWKSDMFVKLLIQHMTGDQLNVRARRLGDTLLHQLCEENRADCVKVCLQRGADVYIRDGSGHTAIHEATLDGKTDCLRVLLGMMVHVNITELGGRTALHLAAWRGNTECVRILLEFGVDANITDGYVLTALDYAIQQSHTETISVLRSVGARSTLKYK